MSTTPSDIHVSPPAPASVPPERWWEGPDFRVVTDLRRRMVGGALPATAPRTAEESARHAMFWLLIEVERLIRQLAARLQAGESVRLCTGICWHEDGRVDFNLRIVDHVETPGGQR
jgi:hypothetical protein